MAKQFRTSSVGTLRPSSRSSIWAGALSIFLLSMIAGLRLCGDNLYKFPNLENSSNLSSDTILFCLAGGKGRIEAALQLYAKNKSKNLYIIGAGKKSTVASLLKNHAPDLNLPPERLEQIQVETESRNTIENAFAVSRVLQQLPEVNTIVLITSGYHMRRAKFMIENQVHRNIEIIPFSPPNESIELETWWQTWLGIQVTTIEYFKFLLAQIMIPRLGYF